MAEKKRTAVVLSGGNVDINLLDLPDSERSNQEARDHEEDVDAEESAIEELGVMEEHSADGECPKSVECRNIAEAP